MKKSGFSFYILVALFSCFILGSSHAQALEWAILPSDIKIIPNTTAFNLEIPELHAAQGEYLAFQIMIAGESPEVPLITAASEAFSITGYEQSFFPIQENAIAGFYASAWIEGDYIADALLPVQGNRLLFGRNRVAALWVDIFVKPEAAAGDYVIEVTLHGESRSIPLRVYAVLLENTASMSVILPIDDGANRNFFAALNGMESSAYHEAINTILNEHYLISGHFAAKPHWTGSAWDFSEFTRAINRIPIGDKFYAPAPFDEENQRFYFDDARGNPYQHAAFEEPYFVTQLAGYFRDLHDYLLSIGRLDDALLYPSDESFWVADEPENNGFAGVMRLEQWAEVIFAHDLAITGSRVLPVAWGPDWITPERLISDSHVPPAYLDAAPQLFADWASNPARSVSLYLNGYGDLMNISAAMNRGIIWYAYARNIRTIAGYAVLEWYDAQWNMIDPLAEPDAYLAYGGYGSGAVIYPNLAASIRLKLWREGVEDSRLLDIYARQGGDAQALAACLTAGDLALQNPPENQWNNAHQVILEAISNQALINLESFCPDKITYENVHTLHIANEAGLADWELDGGSITLLKLEAAQGLQVHFQETPNSLLTWYGSQDWSSYDTLLLDVYNQSSYFTDLDIALGDSAGNYLLLTGSSQILPPNAHRTITLLLETLPFSEESFDWQTVAYLELSAPLFIQRRNRQTNEILTYPTGERSIIIQDIRLASSIRTQN